VRGLEEHDVREIMSVATELIIAKLMASINGLKVVHAERMAAGKEVQQVGIMSYFKCRRCVSRVSRSRAARHVAYNE